MTPIPASLGDHVAACMRDVADRVALPRYRALAAGDVSEKSPGEIVTVVDVESERLLSHALQLALPGSRVVGEEGAAAQPALLNTLDEGDVWLVDPLDGTANFVAGLPDFAIMVSLLRRGETVAAWVLNPVSGELFVAERGAGAWAGGHRLQVPTGDAAAGAASLCGIVKTRFLPPEIRPGVEARARRFAEVFPGTGCAGSDYPDVVRGVPQFALYWRTLPWDHAPGVLLLAEAGGHAARVDARAYRAGDPGTGLLVARDAALWSIARDTLFGALFR